MAEKPTPMDGRYGYGCECPELRTENGLLRDQLAAAKAFRDDLDALRAEEGASVLIGCDNPDEGAGCHVDVEGSWTGWSPLRVPGDTLTDAIHKAREAAAKAKEQEDG